MPNWNTFYDYMISRGYTYNAQAQTYTLNGNALSAEEKAEQHRQFNDTKYGSQAGPHNAAVDAELAVGCAA